MYLFTFDSSMPVGHMGGSPLQVHSSFKDVAVETTCPVLEILKTHQWRGQDSKWDHISGSDASLHATVPDSSESILEFQRPKHQICLKFVVINLCRFCSRDGNSHPKWVSHFGVQRDDYKRREGSGKLKWHFSRGRPSLNDPVPALSVVFDSEPCHPSQAPAHHDL